MNTTKINLLFARAEAARVKQADLQQAALDLERELRSAEVDFKSEPSGDKHANIAVVRQRLENAKEAAVAHAEEIRPVLDEESLAHARARIAELEPATDWRAAIAGPSQRLEKIVADFLAEASTEVRKMDQALEAAFLASREMQEHLRTVGEATENTRRVELGDALGELNKVLGERHGAREQGVMKRPGHAKLWYSQHSGIIDARTVEASLRFEV